MASSNLLIELSFSYNILSKYLTAFSGGGECFSVSGDASSGHADKLRMIVVTIEYFLWLSKLFATSDLSGAIIYFLSSSSIREKHSCRAFLT